MVYSSVKEKICSIDSLYTAMLKCKTSVGWKPSVIEYTLDWASRLSYLHKSLVEGTYRIKPYISFYITEPKVRFIQSTSFKDRIFQRSLCDNYLYDELCRHFVYENVACQKGKGTEFGRNLLEKHMHNYYLNNGAGGFAIKGDIKHFFDSIDHDCLKKVVRRYVRDDWAFDEVCRIIDSYESGIGLGSQVSQLLAMTILTPLDHFIKENLKIKYYVRYADDFIIIHKDKEYLKECLVKISEFLKNYKLVLHEDKTQIIKLSQGIKFLGFKFFTSDSGKVVRKVLRNSVVREKKKLKNQFVFYISKGKFTYERAYAGYQSWRSHLNRSDEHGTQIAMDKYFKDLYNEYKLLNERKKKNKMYNKYIAYNNYEGIDLQKNSVFIQTGTELRCFDNYLFYIDESGNTHPLCYNKSQCAYEYFTQNDDSNGRIRGILLNQILCLIAQAKESDDSEIFNNCIRKILNDDRIKPLRRDEDLLIWDYGFYNADIDLLRHVMDVVTNAIYNKGNTEE